MHLDHLGPLEEQQAILATGVFEWELSLYKAWAFEICLVSGTLSGVRLYSLDGGSTSQASRDHNPISKFDLLALPVWCQAVPVIMGPWNHNSKYLPSVIVFYHSGEKPSQSLGHLSSHLFMFWDRSSLSCPGWSWTQSVAQTGFKLAILLSGWVHCLAYALRCCSLLFGRLQFYSGLQITMLLNAPFSWVQASKVNSSLDFHQMLQIQNFLWLSLSLFL